MSEVKTTYCEVEIVYSEREDKWIFELRGRERKAESLAKAKEAIDKPEPKEKKAFERTKAYKVSNWGDNTFPVCEITSVAEESPYRNSIQVWAVIDGARRKDDASNFAVISTENDAKAKEWKERAKEIQRLQEINRVLVTSMERITVPNGGE